MEDVVRGFRSSVVLLACTCSVLVGSFAHASGIQGLGRITVQGGWRYLPHEDLIDASAAAGHAMIGTPHGGPQVGASLGYGANEVVEATIDLFLGTEALSFENFENVRMLSYGALLGARFVKSDLWVRGLSPYFGVQLGPCLGFVTSKSFDRSEKLNSAYSVNAGVMYRFSETWGVALDYRFLFSARTSIPGIASMNVGGNWFSFGLTYYLPSNGHEGPEVNF